MSVTSAQPGDPENGPLPPVVTFQSGAALLIQLGLVKKISHQGIRHIAARHKDWPFGESREHRYWSVANVTVMETEPFLAFFREHPTVGRGADKQPRQDPER